MASRNESGSNENNLVEDLKPETSFDDLEILTGNAETVLKKIGIPYRVVALCSSRMPFIPILLLSK